MKSIFGVEIPDSLRELTDPKGCGLIVYDMQVGIIGQIEDGAAITDRVKQVLEVARASGMRVFHTRHLSLPKQLMGAFQFRQAMSWQRQEDAEKVQPWFLRDSPGFQIVPELEPLPGEAVFDKITMSAFEEPGSPSHCATAAFALSSSSELLPRLASTSPVATAPISDLFLYWFAMPVVPATGTRLSGLYKPLSSSGTPCLQTLMLCV
jgi:hypothetical protein